MCVIIYRTVRVCVFLLIFFQTQSVVSELDLKVLYDLYSQSLQLMRPREHSYDQLNIKRSHLDYNLNQTLFNSLENYHVGATPAQEADYLWIARVVHSRTLLYPHMCTAVCIDSRIFMTAARCIFSLKIDHTTIVYKGQKFPAQAFVMPSNQSKQLFDDIGLIVVGRTAFREKWAVAKLFNHANRTGGTFQWFEDLGINPNEPVYKVVGYATEKGLHRIKSATRKFLLSELPVIIDINMCSAIYTYNYNIRGFYVPCYHSCTHKQFENKDEQCQNYHGVEGGVIVHMKTKEILGVATWGAQSSKCELPVGFSVPNSRKFYKDLTCAINIRNDDALLMVRGFYQSICENAFK